jgi:hypothetical protein
VNINGNFLGCPQNLDIGNAGVFQPLIDVTPEPDVLLQQVGEVPRREPLGVPAPRYAKSQSDRVSFLSQL